MDKIDKLYAAIRRFAQTGNPKDKAEVLRLRKELK